MLFSCDSGFSGGRDAATRSFPYRRNGISGREGATKLALVTLEQMTQTLAYAVENPPARLQFFDPPQIKLGGQVVKSRQSTMAPA
jgi:hypothetical protein